MRLTNEDEKWEGDNKKRNLVYCDLNEAYEIVVI